MTNPINCSSSPKTDREMIERNRRSNEMKELLSALNSLVSNQNPEELGESDPGVGGDVLENARDYIQKLKEKVEKMKEKRDKLKGIKKCSTSNSNSSNSNRTLLVNVEVREVNSLIEIVFTTGFDDNYSDLLQQILQILHQNGAHQVLNVNLFRLSDRFFHKIIAQGVGEGMTEGGSDFERISETVKKLVSQYKDGGLFNV